MSSKSSFKLSEDSEEHTYLTDVSAKDKPWDVYGVIASRVINLYGDFRLVKRDGTPCKPFADRIASCSQLLGFRRDILPETGEAILKLKTAQFCRCRHCPKCQWRRVLKFWAKLFTTIPSLQQDHPMARYIFLTLTMKNPSIGELRATICYMNKAWNKLNQRKEWPAIGWIKCLEVTRGKDGNPHPHFHCLLMVKPSYFSHGYLSQSRWAELWQSCLKTDYTPNLDVRVVRPKKRPLSKKSELGSDDGLREAILESLKVVFTYSIKPGKHSSEHGAEYQAQWMVGDFEADFKWLLAVTKELDKVRAISTGGLMKNYLAAWGQDEENLININGDPISNQIEDLDLFFAWREKLKRYVFQRAC